MRLHTTKEIGTVVREARRRGKLTQAHLAELIGASRQWVQRLEAGKPGVELGLTLRALLAVGVALETRDPAGLPDATWTETGTNWLLQTRKPDVAAVPGPKARGVRRTTAVDVRSPGGHTVAIPGWNDAPTPVDAPDAAKLRSEQRAASAFRRTP